MNSYNLLILLLLFYSFSIGQSFKLNDEPERIVKNQIELRHDNDFLQFTDRYYTAGNFIAYRRLLKNKKHKRQNSFFLGQEIYTPSDLEETDISKFDRPYASYLGFNFQHTVTGDDWIFDFLYSFGITGEISGGELIQNSFHSTAATDSRTASWTGQINNNFTNNCYFNYIKEWKLIPNPFSVYFAISPSAAIGTKDVYLQNDFVFYFGKRNSITQTVAYNQLGVLNNELFFGIRAGYRYVAHDTMLQGNLIGDSSDFLVEPNNHLLLINTELYFRRGRTDIKIFYNIKSSETKNTDYHLTMTLSIARNF